MHGGHGEKSKSRWGPGYPDNLAGIVSPDIARDNEIARPSWVSFRNLNATTRIETVYFAQYFD
jgi:hypothetical protein